MTTLPSSFLRSLVSALVLWMLASAAAWAADGLMPPSQDPILRINTQMHTASIRKMATDADNRYLVTGSYDKTVRIWNAATGEHLKTLRPPIGDGNEGKIFAVAMSPDGGTVACGGNTGSQWAKTYCVYLFDRESEAVLGRITGLPDAVLHLAYSRDGRHLAVLMARGGGVRVYETQSFSLAAEDGDYQGSVFAGDFDGSGRLVTASTRGYVRLYDPGFKRIAERKTRGGNVPFSVSFSPDGDRVAVGFMDSRGVDVLSGASLERLRRPDTRGVDNGNLGSVAWSADGEVLYAGGKWSGKDGANPVRRWKRQGRGPYSDLSASEKDTILHLLPLQDGIAFCAGDPAFGAFDLEDAPVFDRGPSTIDFRDAHEDFRVSETGDAVQFSYRQDAQTFTGRFSVADRTLRFSPGKDEALKAPSTSVEGLRIRGWENTAEPTVNGKSLELDKREVARCAAVDLNGKTFVLGADWSLRRFDRRGKELWKTQVPDVVRAVNVSGDGRTAVAAHGDGTVRWYRMEDGVELMALFPHVDRKRWVLWTPSGYYDASVGADNIIGWHRNNGVDAAADFFPVSRFRSVYYRPDVTSAVLETLDEGAALEYVQENLGRSSKKVAINEMLPPVVDIVFPENDHKTDTLSIPVKFKIRSPSENPVTGVKILIDGRPAFTDRSFRSAEAVITEEIEVEIPRKDCAISVLAENQYAVSEPATVKVRWAALEEGTGAADLGGDEEFVIKPKLYVLAVGVSEYDREDLRLKFSAKDARNFAEAIVAQEGQLYDEVSTRVLTDAEATNFDVLKGLEWLRKETTQKDVAFLFISGHGMNDNRSGKYYYLPVNADPGMLMATGVPFEAVQTTVESLPGKIILFVDTCYSGNILGQSKGIMAGAFNDVTGVVHELTSAENGAIVFTSSSGNQKSFESEDWGNGAFTKALLEGLSGEADFQGKGKITINMLDLYISERVKELTEGQQTPTTAKPQTIRDFPIAVVDSAGI